MVFVINQAALVVNQECIPLFPDLKAGDIIDIGVLSDVKGQNANIFLGIFKNHGRSWPE